MACMAAKQNAQLFGCRGFCCQCMAKCIKSGDLAPCLSFSRRVKQWLLVKAMIRKAPAKSEDGARERRLVCPLLKVNVVICPCTKQSCPYISPGPMCCLCVERYRAKGSTPKCIKKGFRNESKTVTTVRPNNQANHDGYAREVNNENRTIGRKEERFHPVSR